MNQQTVSKIRAKKTRSREKQAGKEKSPRQPFGENPAVGLLIALLLWLSTVFITVVETLFRGRIEAGFFFHLVGDSCLLLLGLLAAGLFLKIVQPNILKRNMDILMLAVIAIISIVAGKALYFLLVDGNLIEPGAVPFFLPVEMAPLFATILVNGPVAIAIGVWTALVMAIIAEHNFAVLVIGIIATTVTAQTAWRARTRSKVARTGLVIGLCKVGCVLGIVAIGFKQPLIMEVLNRAGACIISGFLSAIIVLLILPLFESLFRVTTDIALLELSDLGHPLLQRLAIEAPGTYHHSLVVANLAQAAADEIGANSLLARVASYFHDAGKLVKPTFFTENMQMRPNPHDDLPPSMSTLVITSHVKEGLSLGMLYKLPAPIMRVITEHHGTSLISYFHHKAKVQMESAPGGQRGTQAGKKLEDAAFRYTGPRPSTRESAIICLADSVEAASRTLEKTTPGHIEGLVDNIVRARVEDGQLDNSGLTLSELVKIKRSFVFSLSNMLHGRVPYPKDEDLNKQPPNDQRDQPAGNTGTDPRPDGASHAA